MRHVATVFVLAAGLALASPSFAQAVVELGPGFGEKTVQLSTSPPSEQAPTAWATGKNGSEHTSAAPTFVIKVRATVQVALRFRSEDGGLVQAYLHNGELKKLWDLALRDERDRGNPSLKRYASQFHQAILPPGSYNLHVSHRYPKSSTRNATLELVEIAARPVMLEPGFRREAGELSNLRGAPWRGPSRIVVTQTADPFVKIDQGPCAGATRSATPLAVLDLPGGLPATRLSLQRGAGIGLYLVEDGGAAHCTSLAEDQRREQARGSVDVPSLPAGHHKLYVLGPDQQRPQRPAHPKGPLYFDVELEDLSRPRPVPWDATTLRWELAGPIDKPLIAQVKPDGRGPARVICDDPRERIAGQQAADRPDLLLDVKRPLEGLLLRKVSFGESIVALEGPFGPDGREAGELRVHCLRSSNDSPAAMPRLEPGLHALRVGLDRNSNTVTLLLGDPKTTQEPAKRVVDPPAEATLEQRTLALYYPMLPFSGRPGGERAFATVDLATRQALFLDAPRRLFVYATFDLDEASASSLNISQLSRPEGTVGYPRQDEALLVLAQDRERLWLLAADGTGWVVKRSYVALTPKGRATVPGALRNVKVTPDDLRVIATPAELREVDTLDKKLDKESACIERKLSGKAEYITVTRARGGSTSTQHHYTDAQKESARRACNTGGEAAEASLTKRIEATYRKRGAEGLAKIAAHLAR